MSYLKPLLVLGHSPEEADSQRVRTSILDGKELVRFVCTPFHGLIIEGVKQRHLWVCVQRVQGMTKEDMCRDQDYYHLSLHLIFIIP